MIVRMNNFAFMQTVLILLILKKTSQKMKAFSFDKISARLEKKSQKQLAEQQNQQNFLRLYDDIPPDPKMQKYVAEIKQQFDQKRKNSRYYSYDLPKKQLTASEAFQKRVEEIRKLTNFKMPFKQGDINQKQRQRERREKQVAEEQAIQKKKKHRVQLKIKFRNQIKIIVSKMKKMKITLEDIMSRQLFKKQPYRFGNQIFLATKEGNSQKVWRILIQNKFSIFSIDNSEKTPLMWSCIRNYPKITKLLLQFGIDPNKRDLNGCDALNYAIRYNSEDCVKYLMLQLANSDERHQQDCKTSQEKVRNIFNVAAGLMKMFRKMKYEKRMELFEQQYDYLHK